MHSREILKVAFLASLGFSGVALAEEPVGFSIEGVNHLGNGCRPGSVAHNISPDGKAVTFLFDSFMVEATPEVRAQQRICELDIKLKVPSGWQVAMGTVDTRGFASLEGPESFGRVRSVYAFGRSQSPSLVVDEKFVGPSVTDFQLRGDVEMQSLEWSPCGGKRMMRLRTRIAARLAPGARTGASLITVDSIDHAVTQKYAMQWRRCPGADDPADSRPLPNLAQSFSAVCKAKQVDRTGRVVNLIAGSGAAFSKQMAIQKALQDAKKRCRGERIGHGGGHGGGHGHGHGGGHGPGGGQGRGGQGRDGNGRSELQCEDDPSSCEASEP